MATAKRKSISKKTRFDIFKRDSFSCQYCGAHPPATVLHVDHINPVANGGTNRQDNLITSCSDCNLGKGARLLSSVPKSLSEKCKEIQEREEQIAGYASVMAAKRDRLESEAWEVAAAIHSGYAERMYPKMMDSLCNFIDILGKHDCLYAANIASYKVYGKEACFKYFCGICWRLIRDQECQNEQ